MLKKFIQTALLLVVLFTTVQSYAQVSQAPDGIQFQALATDANGHPAAGRVIYVKDAIIAKTATGTIVYSETFKVTASSAGIFTIVLGKGTYASGVSSIANIDWANGPFFLNLKVAVEPTVPNAGWNANNEYVDLGTSQFWSVPYALYAGNVKGADGKLNTSDTAAMLKPYFTAINLKANIESPTFTGTVKGITKAMVGLANVDNTSDIDKPVSTATKTALDLKANAADVTTALDLKVDKVSGKALSTNDYTTAEKTKLAAITGTNTGDQDLSALAVAANVNAALALKANTADVTAALDTKVSSTDATAALALKANTADVNAALALKANGANVANSLALKANTTDVNTALGLKANTTDVNTALGLKANTSDVNTALGLKANTTDVNTELALKADDAVVSTQLSTKENSSNKSVNLNTDAASDVKYPSVKSVKTYVDAQIASATISDADVNTKGKIQLAGDLGGTASAPTVPGLTLKANTSDVNNSLSFKVDKVLGKSLSTNDYTTAEKDKLAAISGINTGDQVNITGNAATATKLQNTRTINGIAFDGSANITLPSSGIPYTGATQAVDLGAFDLKVNGLTIGSGKNGLDVNVAIGKNALSNTITGFQGNYITAVGFEALKNDTWGYFNTGIGSSALLSNTTGLANTSVGANSLYSNTTANFNTAVGSSALRLNTTGESNTANGSSALEFSTTGSFNTAIGANGLKSNITGSNNSSVGSGALSFSNTNNNTAMGTNSLKNTTGYSNTALGAFAGEVNTTGNENTAIGVTATFASNNLSNATAIGFGATAAASNSVRLGNTSVTVIGGQVAWTAASDIRIKKNIVNSKYGLSTVLQLRPVEYNLISNDLRQVGFIAQEVQKLVPEVVTGKEGDLNKGEILGITYSNLVPVLTKAIQEQQIQIEILQKELQELKKLVKGLKK